MDKNLFDDFVNFVCKIVGGKNFILSSDTSKVIVFRYFNEKDINIIQDYGDENFLREIKYLRNVKEKICCICL